jgi:hypothetical protein
VSDTADPKLVLSKLESVDEKLRELADRIQLYTRYQNLFKARFLLPSLLLLCCMISFPD